MHAFHAELLFATSFYGDEAFALQAKFLLRSIKICSWVLGTIFSGENTFNEVLCSIYSSTFRQSHKLARICNFFVFLCLWQL